MDLDTLKSGDSEERFRKVFLAAVISAFLALSLLYSFFTPVFESQDEEHHFAFITHLANRMELPDFRKAEDVNSAGCQANQTPLYYFFQGLLLRAFGQRQITLHLEENPFRSAGTPALYLHNQLEEKFPYNGGFLVVHLLRLTNIVAGIIILLIIYKSAQLMPFQNRNIPVVIAAFAGFIPQFTYICGTLNNDVFCVLFSSLAFFFLMKFLLSSGDSGKYAICERVPRLIRWLYRSGDSPESTAQNTAPVILGTVPVASVGWILCMSIALGLAILSKQMALAFVPPMSLAVLLKGANRERVRNGAVVALALAALVGWYYARNWLLFSDLFATKAQMEVLAPNLVQKKSVVEMFSYFPNYFARIFLNSFWGSFGYMTVQLSWGKHLFYNVLAGAGLVAFAAGLIDGEFRKQFTKQHKVILLLMAFACLLLLIEILLFNMSLSQPQGRYAFNALVCLAVVWGLGVDRIINGRRVHKNVAFMLIVALLALLNLHVLTGTVRKAYPPLPQYINSIQKESDTDIGELTSGSVVGQTFYCNADGLDTVAILLTTFGRYNNCHVVFHLRDLANPVVDVVTKRFSASELQDNTFHLFKFPALKNSGGRNYLFLLESPDAREGQAISCFYTQKDLYPYGQAVLNNLMLKGDLAFITGCN